MLALEVLQVIAKNDNARRAARILDTGVARDICSAIGYAATDKPKKPTDSRANVTVVGLEILHILLADVESDVNTQSVLESQAAIAFLDAVASERHFVKALCSTLMLKTGMKLPAQDEDGEETSYEIPKLFGPPLVLVRDECSGYDNTHEAVAAILFTVAVYACAIDSKRSHVFWNACLLKDAPPSTDPIEAAQTAAAFSAHFLELIGNDYGPFTPKDALRLEDFNLISKPLVRHHLLEALRDSINSGSSDNKHDPFFNALFAKFNVPKILLSLWSDPALLDVSFGLLKQIVEVDPDDILHLFVESKEAILALFSMLNLEPASGIETDVSELRRFLAGILNSLAENGLLTEAITNFDVRSSAIEGLAAACLTDDETSTQRGDDDDEDMTSNRLSSGLMKCLVEICTIRDASGKSKIVLTSMEAQAIAKNLGKKICTMVLSRFLERARLHQYEMEEEEEIMQAPDVAMLTAVAQHDGALQILRRIGGLHALSQIASEGEISAVLVLKKACEDDFSLLLQADTFLSILSLFSKEDHMASWRMDVPLRRQLEGAAFGLLGRLCDASFEGRKAVGAAEACEDCLARAVEIVGSMVGKEEDDEAATPTIENAEIDCDEEAEADEAGVATETPPPYPAAPPATPGEIQNMDDAALCAAAMSFLSGLIPLPNIRKEILNNHHLIKASCSLGVCKSQRHLQYEAIKLIKALAPYATQDDTLNPELIASVLIDVLKLDATGSKNATVDKEVNTNLLHGVATAGVQIVLNSLSIEKQLDLARVIAARFTQTVKAATSARGDRLHGGQLAYNLTTVLMLARGKDSTESVFVGPLLTSLVHLIQWRYDPKTKFDGPDEYLWKASVTQSLQILSMTLTTTEERLVDLNVKKSDLSSTVLMVARAGKAPRKAIDLPAALTKAAAGDDAACSVAAKSVQTLLN